MNMTKFIKIIWILSCVTVLTFSFIKKEISDTDIAFIYLMVFLTFPIGAIVCTIIGFLIKLIYMNFGITIPGGFVHNLIIWMILVIAGYFQWFCFFPRIVAHFKKGS